MVESKPPQKIFIFNTTRGQRHLEVQPDFNSLQLFFSSSSLNRLRINGACPSWRSCYVRTPGSTTRITPPLPSHPRCSCFGLVRRGAAASASELNRTNVILSWVCVGARTGSLPDWGYPPLEITRFRDRSPYRVNLGTPLMVRSDGSDLRFISTKVRAVDANATRAHC